MKQSIKVNIGGRIFHIDDDAYRSLNQYLDRIRQYFKRAGEAEDIMDDIESRISELLFEKTGVDGIVSQRHVEEIMKEMGNPEAFNPLEEPLDSEDKNNTGYDEQDAHARLFRDPDDKVLGGVCAGIGHYFGIDPLWLRLAFAVSILIFGSGVLLYVILWVIIPVAQSTADKLQMKGRPVNISNIEESLRDEMKDMKNRFDCFKNDAKNFKASKHARRVRGMAHDLGDSFRNFLRGIGHSAKAIIGALLIITTMIILFAFVASLAGFGQFDGLTYSTMSGFLFEKGTHLFWSTLALLLAVGIPVLLLLVKGITWLLGLNQSIRGFRGGLMILWIISIVILFYHGTRLASDFKYRGEADSIIESDSVTTDSIFLSLSHPATESIYNSFWFVNGDYDVAFVKDNHLILKTISISIGSNSSDRVRVQVEKSARGGSRTEARDRAADIDYSVSLREDKILLDPEFVLNEDVWRNQQVKIILSIPEGKTCIVNPELEPYIENHYMSKADPQRAKSYQY